MAHVNSIWVYGSNKLTGTIGVMVSLKPAGLVHIDVPIPPKFFDALLDLAQKAADAHEAQMRCEILGDTAKENV